MKGIATGVGSLPHKSYFTAVQAVLRYCPKAPYWPQLPHSFLKDRMICQFLNSGSIKLSNKGDRWHYRLTGEPWIPPRLEGLEILALVVSGKYEWIKGQLTGPLTLGLSLVDEDERPLLLHEKNFRFLENALLESLRIQLSSLMPASKKILIFLDEPLLGLPVAKDHLPAFRSWYREFIQKMRGFGAIPGLHCCSDFSWEEILSLKPEAVNFDAYRYPDSFVRAREAVSLFVSQGGYLAFGIVPSGPEVRNLSDEELYASLKNLLKSLRIVPDLFFLTPSCGLGTLEEELAEEILARTSLLAERFA